MVAGRARESLRIGQGLSSQRLAAGRSVVLAGLEVVLQVGDIADDGDVVSKALLNALTTSLSLPGIDILFPADETDAMRENSLVLLSQTVTALQRRQLDCVVSASVSLHSGNWRELTAHWEEMCGMLASALQLPRDAIGLSISAVPEGLDRECLYAFASLICRRRDAASPPPREAVAGTAKPAAAAQQLFDATPPPAPPPAARPEPTEDILDDPTLPSRAREFETAVRSGLPPLPRAKTPAAGSTLYVYTDGASRGNPGKAATGFVVMDAAGLLVHEGGSRLEDCTNNQAEYRALLEALSWIERNLGHEFNLEVRMDSELIVKQLRGEYKVRHEDLKPLSMQAMNLLMYFSSFALKHVPRAENRRADALANEVLDRG